MLDKLKYLQYEATVYKAITQKNVITIYLERDINPSNSY